MANNADKTHALEMLGKYLPEGAAVYMVVVGHNSGSRGSTFKRVFTTIADGRIVNLNIYIANLIGIRRDGWGNTSSRETPQEIVDAVAFKLGRKLKIFSM